MLSGWEAPWLHRTERAKARQVQLVTHTFLTVDTPGTPPGTPVCILVPNRARLGPYGADGRIGRPHRIPGEGKGLTAFLDHFARCGRRVHWGTLRWRYKLEILT